MSRLCRVRFAGLAVLSLLAVVVIAVCAFTGSGVKPYDDVRGFPSMPGIQKKDVSTADPKETSSIIRTLTYNQDTVWPEGCKAAADRAMEEAKNPGLGIRDLHKEGITGKGVNVAIIDQPLYLDHPEFAGKIVQYKNTCSDGGDSSMHGPAVASILVGKTIGAAPGARLYYVAAPSWSADAADQARALHTIVDWNQKLPKGQMIRVVSISAAPSGPGSPFKNGEKWDEAVARAEKAGILVLDCTENHGFIGSCYFPGSNREDPAECRPGFPGNEGLVASGRWILVPTSPRTTAEEYDKGACKYQYTGQGGLSWGIPYAAGVLAMGWQVNPQMTKEQALDMLKKSTRDVNGAKIIDPKAFIQLVRKSK